MPAPLTFPSIRFLTERGVLQGNVISIRTEKLAHSVKKQHPELVIVHVHDAGQQGCFWAMSAADAQRMVAVGYPAIE